MDWSNITQVENVANGLLIIILGILSWLGWNRGKGKGRPEQTAEIAGAIVDNSALLKVAAAIEAQTLEMIAHRMQQKDLATSEKDNARAIERGLLAMTKEIEDAKDEIRRLGDSLTRRPP